MRKITLVRHGKSAHGEAFRATRLRDMAAVLRSYDEAGIADGSLPSAEVVACIADAKHIVCSPLQRSRESAHRLLRTVGTGRTSDAHEDNTYREVDLGDPPHMLLDIALHPTWWVCCLRTLWLLRLQNGDVESPRLALRRAGEAGDKLAALAATHGHVALVGHGLLNYLIAWGLVRQGWQGKPRFQSYWECTSFKRETSE